MKQLPVFLLQVIVVGVLVFGAAFLFPWKLISWGKIEIAPQSTITVTGTAQQQERNQIARYSAGVEATNADKQTAVDEVNTAMNDVVDMVKQFGIDEADIQTQGVSVNRYEQPQILGSKNSGDTEWRAYNGIEITLRDVDKASELTDLLSSSKATNVYGPNFGFDDTSKAETDLLSKAIENARVKAEEIAKGSNQTLGRILNVYEGGSTSTVTPLRSMAAGMGGGAPIETGSGTVSSSVTVVFELQ